MQQIMELLEQEIKPFFNSNLKRLERELTNPRRKPQNDEEREKMKEQSMKLFALESIGFLLDLSGDKKTQEAIIHSFYIQFDSFSQFVVQKKKASKVDFSHQYDCPMNSEKVDFSNQFETPIAHMNSMSSFEKLGIGSPRTRANNLGLAGQSLSEAVEKFVSEMDDVQREVEQILEQKRQPITVRLTPQEMKQDLSEKKQLNEVLDSLIVEKQTFTHLVGQSGNRKEQMHDAETGTTLTLQQIEDLVLRYNQQMDQTIERKSVSSNTEAFQLQDLLNELFDEYKKTQIKPRMHKNVQTDLSPYTIDVKNSVKSTMANTNAVLSRINGKASFEDLPKLDKVETQSEMPVHGIGMRSRLESPKNRHYSERLDEQRTGDWLTQFVTEAFQKPSFDEAVLTKAQSKHVISSVIERFSDGFAAQTQVELVYQGLLNKYPGYEAGQLPLIAVAHILTGRAQILHQLEVRKERNDKQYRLTKAELDDVAEQVKVMLQAIHEKNQVKDLTKVAMSKNAYFNDQDFENDYLYAKGRRSLGSESLPPIRISLDQKPPRAPLHQRQVVDEAYGGSISDASMQRSSFPGLAFGQSGTSDQVFRLQTPTVDVVLESTQVPGVSIPGFKKTANDEKQSRSDFLNSKRSARRSFHSAEMPRESVQFSKEINRQRDEAHFEGEQNQGENYSRRSPHKQEDSPQKSVGKQSWISSIIEDIKRSLSPNKSSPKKKEVDLKVAAGIPDEENVEAVQPLLSLQRKKILKPSAKPPMKRQISPEIYQTDEPREFPPKLKAKLNQQQKQDIQHHINEAINPHKPLEPLVNQTRDMPTNNELQRRMPIDDFNLTPAEKKIALRDLIEALKTPPLICELPVWQVNQIYVLRKYKPALSSGLQKLIQKPATMVLCTTQLNQTYIIAIPKENDSGVTPYLFDRQEFIELATGGAQVTQVLESQNQLFLGCDDDKILVLNLKTTVVQSLLAGSKIMHLKFVNSGNLLLCTLAGARYELYSISNPTFGKNTQPLKLLTSLPLRDTGDIYCVVEVAEPTKKRKSSFSVSPVTSPKHVSQDGTETEMVQPYYLLIGCQAGLIYAKIAEKTSMSGGRLARSIEIVGLEELYKDNIVYQIRQLGRTGLGEENYFQAEFLVVSYLQDSKENEFTAYSRLSITQENSNFLFDFSSLERDESKQQVKLVEFHNRVKFFKHYDLNPSGIATNQEPKKFFGDIRVVDHKVEQAAQMQIGVPLLVDNVSPYTGQTVTNWPRQGIDMFISCYGRKIVAIDPEALSVKELLLCKTHCFNLLQSVDVHQVTTTGIMKKSQQPVEVFLLCKPTPEQIQEEFVRRLRVSNYNNSTKPEVERKIRSQLNQMQYLRRYSLSQKNMFGVKAMFIK